MSDRPNNAAVKAQPRREEIADFLAEKRRHVQARTTSEMIAVVLVELNRQLEPLIESSQRSILDQEDLDRMIGINSAVLAIHRALGPLDGEQEFTEAELLRAAKR